MKGGQGGRLGWLGELQDGLLVERGPVGLSCVRGTLAARLELACANYTGRAARAARGIPSRRSRSSQDHVEACLFEHRGSEGRELCVASSVLTKPDAPPRAAPPRAAPPRLAPPRWAPPCSAGPPRPARCRVSSAAAPPCHSAPPRRLARRRPAPLRSSSPGLARPYLIGRLRGTRLQ